LKNYIIDTNALISFVTDRNPAQQDKVAKLLASAPQLKVRALCRWNVISEFAYVMDSVYRINKS
jgi:predicted nucleic acid-binding protein